MRQWEVFLFPYPSSDEPHPFVIVSNNGICENPEIKVINGLFCQTVRPEARAKKRNEVYLHREDGLDWKTLVKCDFLHVLHKREAIHRRGEVCAQRISEIRRLMHQLF